MLFSCLFFDCSQQILKVNPNLKDIFKNQAYEPIVDQITSEKW